MFLHHVGQRVRILRPGRGYGVNTSFISVRQAARFAFDEKVSEAEIVVRCDLLEEEVVVPLVPEWCDLPQPDPAAN